MADLINLRRARKAKARGEKEREAQANRTKHGVAKPVRDLAKARAEKDAHALDVHRIDDKK
jgi:hypothetical protein